MSTGVVWAVLGAAALHATWNALLKGSRTSKADPLAASTGLALSWALLGSVLVFVAPPPAPASWPWLALSMVCHLGYFALLSAAYRVGDLSYVYPLMRGLPPVAVTLGAAVMLGEVPQPLTGAGIGLVVAGVFVLAPPSVVAAGPRVTAMACGAAGFIAGYTLLDGVGVRASGTPVGYLVWLSTVQGGLFAAGALTVGGRPLWREVRARWAVGLTTGVLSAAGYLVALWAVTQAAIAPVAALRETSVVFAAVLGTVVLGEPFGRRRVVAAILVAIGVTFVRWSG